MIEFQADSQTTQGYLAVPARGSGPGVLVLHAWWGLNAFFKQLCDRLAAEGFVAFAPDLYNGKTAATIDEAKQLLKVRDLAQMEAKALAAVEVLRRRPAVTGAGLGAIGFSMGAAWAGQLSSLRPDDFAAVVLFYGIAEADFAAARAAYLGHFAEHDEWEPLEGVRQLEADLHAAGRDVTFHLYPEAGHWFFEDDRPDAYDAGAARLAWERTLTFLRERLGQ
ncbi:MAG TPA: dienelactone hydrolase family protein [Anaerolineae bacterium]|nr:dienelactone hydrolase family protein [Anaerolineae bacterium]